jgi:fumarylacetoacetase
MTSPDYAHHFSARNIPFGIASSKVHSKPQAVTRLGNSVVFLHDCHSSSDLFRDVDELPHGVFADDTLNKFAALPKPIHRHVREAIQSLYVDGTLDVSKLPPGSGEDITQVQMHMPVTVGDFAGMYIQNPLSAAHNP